eukprot:TRINITY_DN12471_c0_g1_i1.p1 TRINITY_DN12471_c0_g1~~TRINITY_DN12471_c0_g1_i1.p1  ORF type:complete len:213 (-),score=18.69 TRINITY_DN12471_c0_g1_i1:187-795(-)
MRISRVARRVVLGARHRFYSVKVRKRDAIPKSLGLALAVSGIVFVKLGWDAQVFFTNLSQIKKEPDVIWNDLKDDIISRTQRSKVIQKYMRKTLPIEIPDNHEFLFNFDESQSKQEEITEEFYQIGWGDLDQNLEEQNWISWHTLGMRGKTSIKIPVTIHLASQPDQVLCSASILTHITTVNGKWEVSEKYLIDDNVCLKFV